MNEDTKTILNQFLSSLMEGLNKAGAFITEQLPLVLQEYITWGIVKGMIVFIVGIAAMLSWKKWIYDPAKIRLAELRRKDSLDAMDVNMWIGVSGIVALTVLAVGIFCGLLPATKAIFAPRVYLIEEISKLVK